MLISCTTCTAPTPSSTQAKQRFVNSVSLSAIICEGQQALPRASALCSDHASMLEAFASCIAMPTLLSDIDKQSRASAESTRRRPRWQACGVSCTQAAWRTHTLILRGWLCRASPILVCSLAGFKSLLQQAHRIPSRAELIQMEDGFLKYVSYWACHAVECACGGLQEHFVDVAELIWC